MDYIATLFQDCTFEPLLFLLENNKILSQDLSKKIIPDRYGDSKMPLPIMVLLQKSPPTVSKNDYLIHAQIKKQSMLKIHDVWSDLGYDIFKADLQPYFAYLQFKRIIDGLDILQQGGDIKNVSLIDLLLEKNYSFGRLLVHLHNTSHEKVDFSSEGVLALLSEMSIKSPLATLSFCLNETEFIKKYSIDNKDVPIHKFASSNRPIENLPSVKMAEFILVNALMSVYAEPGDLENIAKFAARYKSDIDVNKNLGIVSNHIWGHLHSEITNYNSFSVPVPVYLNESSGENGENVEDISKNKEANLKLKAEYNMELSKANILDLIAIRKYSCDAIYQTMSDIYGEGVLSWLAEKNVLNFLASTQVNLNIINSKIISLLPKDKLDCLGNIPIVYAKTCEYAKALNNPNTNIYWSANGGASVIEILSSTTSHKELQALLTAYFKPGLSKTGLKKNPEFHERLVCQLEGALFNTLKHKNYKNFNTIFQIAQKSPMFNINKLNSENNTLLIEALKDQSSYDNLKIANLLLSHSQINTNHINSTGDHALMTYLRFNKTIDEAPKKYKKHQEMQALVGGELFSRTKLTSNSALDFIERTSSVVSHHQFQIPSGSLNALSKKLSDEQGNFLKEQSGAMASFSLLLFTYINQLVDDGYNIKKISDVFENKDVCFLDEIITLAKTNKMSFAIAFMNAFSFNGGDNMLWDDFIALPRDKKISVFKQLSDIEMLDFMYKKTQYYYNADNRKKIADIFSRMIELIDPSATEIDDLFESSKINTHKFFNDSIIPADSVSKFENLILHYSTRIREVPVSQTAKKMKI